MLVLIPIALFVVDVAVAAVAGAAVAAAVMIYSSSSDCCHCSGSNGGSISGHIGTRPRWETFFFELAQVWAQV